MNWKKYLGILISTIAALILTRQIIDACTDFDYYDSYPQFFGNDAPNKPAYIPFNFIDGPIYYSDDDFWNGQQYVSVSDSINKAALLKEWKNFLPVAISAHEIENLFYHTTLTAIEKLGKVKKNKADNQLSNYLSEEKNKNIYDYILYAKKCEENALAQSEDWGHPATGEKTNNIETLLEEGVSSFKKEKNDFLKMKYAFQILRIAYYHGDYQQVLAYFDSLLNGKSDHSVAYTRCLGFKAGAYYRLGDRITAGYYYTKMFDNSNAYKVAAMTSFQWSVYHKDENNFPKIYVLCNNNHERAVAMEMKTLRDYSLALDEIKKTYSLDPDLSGMGVLINREINKVEQYYFSDKIYSLNQLSYPISNYYPWMSNPIANSEHKSDSLDKVYQPYIHNLNVFLDQLISDNRTGTQALWHLSKAYLACMQQNAQAMNLELKAASDAGMNTNETAVYQVIDLLYTIYKTPKITAATEAEILPKLQNLDREALSNYHASFQFRDIMSNLIAGRYFQQGDTIKGIYAMGHALSWKKKNGTRIFEADPDFQDVQGEVLNNMTVAKLEKVIAFREQPGKSAFEQWLVHAAYYTPEVLKELLGTKYIREYDFKNAIKIYEQKGIPDRIFPNPFMPQINDQFEIYHRDTIRQYSKLSFSKRMATLKEIITKNPEDAGALYGYAVALYNISYYGKSSYISNYSRHTTDPRGYYQTDQDKDMPQYLKEYFRLDEAERYFNRAAKAATDPELKAKALWGAAKCWTKRSPVGNNHNPYFYNDDDLDSYYLNALNSPYFKTLSTELAQTKFMEQVSNTCEYYSDYLNKKN